MILAFFFTVRDQQQCFLSAKIASRNIRYKIPSPLLRYRKSIFLVASYIFFSTTLRDPVTSFSFVKVGIGSSFNVSIKEIKRENIIIYNFLVIPSSLFEGFFKQSSIFFKNLRYFHKKIFAKPHPLFIIL